MTCTCSSPASLCVNCRDGIGRLPRRAVRSSMMKRLVGLDQSRTSTVHKDQMLLEDQMFLDEEQAYLRNAEEFKTVISEIQILVEDDKS